MVQSEGSWPGDGGKTGANIQQKDWSVTPLGPVNEWSQSLRTHINLILESEFPAIIGWGPDLTSIYNDAFKVFLGNKNPALGNSFYKNWPVNEVLLKPVVEKVLAGEASTFSDIQLELRDRTTSCDLYFSPLRDDCGTITGILTIPVETGTNNGSESGDLNSRAKKRIDDQLRKRIEHLNFILESTNFGYWNLNLLTGEGERSFQYDKCFGATEPFDNWNLEKFLSYIHPDDQEDIEKKLNKAIEEQNEWHFECRVIWDDNSIHWLDCHGNVSRTIEGKPVRLLSIVSDITARKQDKAKIRESEKRLQIALKTGKLGSWQLELSDNSFISSDICKANVGLSPETELTFDRLQKLVHPDDRQKCNAKIEHAVENHTDFESECRVRWPNGEIHWILIRGHALYDQDGIPVRILGVTLDITERRQREEELKKNETRLRLATQIANLGTWQYDPETGLVHLDRQMRAILGEPNSETKRTFSDVLEYIHPDDQVSVKRAINDALDPSTGSTTSLEYRIVQDDGTIRWLSANGQAQFDKNTNEPVGFMGTARDITERKYQEAKLETMNETLEERIEERTKSLLSYQDQLRSLASQLSKAEEQERRSLAAELHDNLGQLLTVCKMKISELQNDGLPDHTATGINELSEFVDEAISYTRELMAELKPPPTIDEKDLYGIMKWIAKKMDKHGLEVSIENDGQPKPVDKEVRTTLLQAVRELLFNVVKHTYVKQARLTLLRREGYVEITVEDEGKGFNPEEKKKAPSEEGGFGLFNIRERMDLLGGKLEIKSEPGKGTKAILYAPLKKTGKSEISYRMDGTTSPASPAKSSVQTELWQTAKILIVDDHKMVRRGLRKMIENQNDLVVIGEASTGEEAIKSARETSPDVIVMDVNLPGIDGIEATRKISTEMPNIRIIGLSLHDENGVAEEMRNAGASAYLTKTEAFETLCATIRSEATMAKE